MKYKIVLVPFPFDDFSETKVRPAVCLTKKIGKYNHIVIAFITSQTPPDKTPTDIVLEKSDETGLKINSMLRLHRLTTIPFDLIKRQLGQVPAHKKVEIQNKLFRLFGLK
ncbi:MAG: growth inhibitor PemK [Bacteroidetes bacterium CG23_combo_of_CG06-09_8_20_14_all_32_9]|nr:MAG: growth inhibitor PemK [Bacteroidetes bacterium CG23_combo_of_CG06-09_8_20_14_all_32_9]